MWVVPLIPTALLVSTLKQIFTGGHASLSHVYFATTVVSCGVLLTTILYLMRFLPKLGHRIHNAYLAVPAVGTLLFLLITQNGKSTSFSYHRYTTNLKNIGIDAGKYSF